MIENNDGLSKYFFLEIVFMHMKRRFLYFQEKCDKIEKIHPTFSRMSVNKYEVQKMYDAAKENLASSTHSWVP